MTWTIDDIPDLGGRIALVTGANAGLGLETVRALASHGALVLMAVRDVDRGARARTAILATDQAASLEVVRIDLASLDSIRRGAEAIAAAHPRIDILVNNGGVMGIPYRESADGLELQLAVNHLGHFALTGLLLPCLLRADRARVVSLTSTGRFLGRPLDPADVSMGSSYDPWRAYGRAKLSVVQFTIELDRRARAVGARLRAMAADPGFAATDLQANAARLQPGRSQRFFDATVHRFGSTPAQGASPTLRAATDPRAQGGSLYALAFVLRGPPVRVPYLTRYLGNVDRARSWAASERLTGVRIDLHAAVRDSQAEVGSAGAASGAP